MIGLGSDLFLLNVLPTTAPHRRRRSEREILLALRIGRGEAWVRGEQVIAHIIAVYVARSWLSHDEHTTNIQVPLVVEIVDLAIPWSRSSEIHDQV